jgi:hypothetical protein
VGDSNPSLLHAMRRRRRIMAGMMTFRIISTEENTKRVIVVEWIPIGSV